MKGVTLIFIIQNHIFLHSSQIQQSTDKKKNHDDFTSHSNLLHLQPDVFFHTNQQWTMQLL